MTEAAEERLVKEAIKQARERLEQLHKTGQLKVLPEDLILTLGDDHTGDPSVFVTAILPDTTGSDLWKTPVLRPIIDTIHEEIAGKDVERLVYVRFSTREAIETPPDDEEVA